MIDVDFVLRSILSINLPVRVYEGNIEGLCPDGPFLFDGDYYPKHFAGIISQEQSIHCYFYFQAVH